MLFMWHVREEMERKVQKVNSRYLICGTSIVLAISVFVWLAGPVTSLSKTESVEKAWTTSTFLDFSDGTLADGGENTYVTAAGEIRLINQWDLNQDGFLDIVFPNTHDNNQQIDLFIYGGVHGFDVHHVGFIPDHAGGAGSSEDM